MRPVSVVFIDLQGSSAFPAKRDELQRRLMALRDQLNRTFQSDLAVAFQVVWGDELKCVLHDAGKLWAMYRQAYAAMQGVPFRFAVGFGTVDTEFPAGVVDINMLDGAAFKAARMAMDELKACPCHPYQIRFGASGNKQYVAALNAYITVLNDIVTHMTPAQKRHFMAEFPWNQEGSSEVARVSRQAVWETLQRARVDAYKAACAGLDALLTLGSDAPALLLPGGGDA